MSEGPRHDLQKLAPGMLLALFSILFGFLLGGLFGSIEDSIKGQLRSSADAVFDTAYQGDAAKRDAVVGKSWSYLKRAHLHGGAIGAAALASTVLLGLLGSVGRLERLASISFGAGALLYASFWLAAGFTAPGVGSTHDAKEALWFLAFPGSGLAILGLLGTIASVGRFVVRRDA